MQYIFSDNNNWEDDDWENEEEPEDVVEIEYLRLDKDAAERYREIKKAHELEISRAKSKNDD